jgi:ABC-2 type transport system ATP-binding protein
MLEAHGISSSMIEFVGLGKRYGDFSALQDVHLSVGRGELFGLLGPNGAGKTTSMKLLMGFLKPSAGTARIAGLDCFRDRVELKRVVGYLPDEPVFYDYLRGREIVEFVGDMHGLSRSETRARSQPLFEQLEIFDAVEDYAINYSRGMKKKLALVCALLHDPPVLVLDEPTSGLDPLATRRLNDLLAARKRSGTTILLSSHLLDQVEKLCERVAIVARGQVAAIGKLSDLKQQCGENASLEQVFFAVTGAGAEGAEPA